MTRMFLALWPPPDARSVIEALPRNEVAGVRFMSPETWHLTLHFLGEVNEEAATGAFDQMAKHLLEGASPAKGSATRLIAGPETATFGSHVLYVPVRGCEALASWLASQPWPSGKGGSPGRRFRGHITIARSSSVDLRKMAGQRVSSSWQAGEITLVRSVPLTGGARSAAGREPGSAGGASYEVVRHAKLQGM